jgi:hypothetical protein
MLEEDNWIGLQFVEPRERVVYDGTKDVMACWRIVLLVRERREPYFPYQTLCLRAQVSYEIEYRQVIEGVEVEQIL